MSHIENIISLASLAQKMYGRLLFQRLIFGIVLVAGLTIIIAIMTSAVLIGVLYVAYVEMLHYNVETHVAVIFTAILAVFVVFILVMITIFYLRRLRRVPQTMIEHSPLASYAMGALNSFIDGFMKESRPPEKPKEKE